jgi:hypothetical protein
MSSIKQSLIKARKIFFQFLSMIGAWTITDVVETKESKPAKTKK